MVPEGWRSDDFSGVEIAVIDGDRGKEYPKSGELLDDGYCVFLSAKNVTKAGFKFDDVQFICEEKHRKLRKGEVRRGNLVLTTRGTVGQFAYFDDSVPYNVIRINSGMVILDTAQSELSSEFLYALCRSRLIGKQIEAAAFGSAQPALTVKIIKKLRVPVPPLPEQKKIAQILSTWDQAITATERLLENSQQRKKGLMQQLLTGKKRLLSDDGTLFNGDWQQKSIEDYFSVGSSKRVLQKDWESDGVPFYRTRELVSLAKKEPFRSEIFISEALFWELSQKFGAPAAGDFLVSGVGTLGIGYRVKEGDQFYFKDGNVLWFRPKDGIDSRFFEYCFQHEYIQNQITSQASITTVGTYTIQNAKRTRFYCPPTFEEQQKVARVLMAADHDIDCLHQCLKQLKHEKKALMQQLLTGKRRVQVDAKAA